MDTFLDRLKSPRATRSITCTYICSLTSNVSYNRQAHRMRTIKCMFPIRVSDVCGHCGLSKHASLDPSLVHTTNTCVCVSVGVHTPPHMGHRVRKAHIWYMRTQHTHAHFCATSSAGFHDNLGHLCARARSAKRDTHNAHTQILKLWRYLCVEHDVHLYALSSNILRNIINTPRARDASAMQM